MWMARPGATTGRIWRANLQDLSRTAQARRVPGKPVRRVFIPKSDGRQRPLGVPVLEDKIVQRAVVEVLNAIYEEDFLGFSYGFRPKRSPHQALDALTVGITHEEGELGARCGPAQLLRYVEARVACAVHRAPCGGQAHRAADPEMARLPACLRMASGYTVRSVRSRAAVSSPLLANIYLHYVFDLWVQRWRQEAGARRCHRRALRGRLRRRVPASSRGRAVPSGAA